MNSAARTQSRFSMRERSRKSDQHSNHYSQIFDAMYDPKNPSPYIETAVSPVTTNETGAVLMPKLPPAAAPRSPVSRPPNFKPHSPAIVDPRQTVPTTPLVVSHAKRGRQQRLSRTTSTLPAAPLVPPKYIGARQVKASEISEFMAVNYERGELCAKFMNGSHFVWID